MSRQQIIERERRMRPWAAVGAVLPLVFYVIALIIESGSGIEIGGLQTDRLRSVDEHSDTLLLATVARSLGFAFLAVPLFYLFRAVQARSERVQGLFLPLVVLGPVILAVQGLIGFFGEREVAAEFVSQASGVGDIYSLAENLRDESGAVQTAAGLLLPGMLAMIFSLIYTPLWAVRTGLLPRFFGTLGMALGASLLFLLQIALLALLFWFAYFAMVLLGRGPRGRPPAWDAGEAIPWPAPGEDRDEGPERGAEEETIEGDATEIPGLEEENPHLARRERAKRRKRKRRR